MNRTNVPLTNLLAAALAALLTSWFLSERVWSQGSQSDYDRSASYRNRTRGQVFGDSISPHWFGKNGETENNRFWYRIETSRRADKRRTYQFVLVDTKSGTRNPAFDHTVLAESISKATKRKVDSRQLPLDPLVFDDDATFCRFKFNGQSWKFKLPDGPLSVSKTKGATKEDTRSEDALTPLAQIEPSHSGEKRTPIEFDNRLKEPIEVLWVDSDGRRRFYQTVAAGKTHSLSTYVGHAWLVISKNRKPLAAFRADGWQELAIIDSNTPAPKPLERKRRRPSTSNQSPDGKWTAEIRNHNVYLSEVGGETQQVSRDGTEDDRYVSPVYWSPDQKHFVVRRKLDVHERQIGMIDSAPDNSIHGKLKTINYVKPGDKLDQYRPVLFHTDGSPSQNIPNDDFDNAFNLTDFAWHADSKSFSFLFNQRGHETLRWITVDAKTGLPRTVIDETSETFVCYSGKKFLRRLDATNEVIWMSERSGWNHLYLIDQKTGDVKNAITSGDWVVREVEYVDEENRQLWLKVGGIDPDQDPYHVHLVRVDFDGKNLTRITRGDGDHQWRFSPDRRFIIDEYSRVDLPPVVELRSCESGELVCQLESADASGLLKAQGRFPERFVTKGRDGKTDIHGIIVRPTNFDSNKRYPVLEAIYAGPHSAFVPKRFGTHISLFEMAELGFIVVKIDGMGTSHRSKAFHDVCWKNLGDSGFPDRIAWMKAAAKDRPEMDLSRVGIWGGSAGGQSAMRALIAHGNFYKAAVADCGCHDNRVDKIWWNEQWMGWPIGPHYADQSNVTQAHRVKGDLMLIWGELDTNVDPVSTTQVIDALIKANIDFEQLMVPGAGHGAAGHPYAKRRQSDFFIRKLWKKEPRYKVKPAAGSGS